MEGVKEEPHEIHSTA